MNSTQSIASDAGSHSAPFFLWRHLNKLRWCCLSLVFLALLLLPLLAVYQNFLAAHAYDLLAPGEKLLYDSMETITAPFVNDPLEDLNVVKGNTWSANIGGYKISDPLAVVGHIIATENVYLPFVLTALLPVMLTLLFGRFYCGWICPATFLYELNTNFTLLLQRFGLRTGRLRLDKRLKYGVLAACLALSIFSGTVLVAAIYPPAIIGRESLYGLALGGFSSGALFMLATLLFDTLVARRGFCRYLCPGGALYSLLGRYRLLRIKRVVERCNDCAKCNAVCEFDLDPMGDDFGQECNNCTACIASCPTDAMTFAVRWVDTPPQGPGHLGKDYRRNH